MLKQLIPFWNYFKETSLTEDYLRKLCGKYVARSWLRTAANFKMFGFKYLVLDVEANLNLPCISFTWRAMHNAHMEEIYGGSYGFSTPDEALTDACNFLKKWVAGADGTGS